MTESRRERSTRLGWAVALLVLLWIGSGIRRVPGEERFGVLDGRALGERAYRIDSGWVVAPWPLLRFTLYSTRAEVLALPDAESADVRAVDGSRFGLVGWARVRASAPGWRELHAASEGRGLRRVLLDAVRAAGPALEAEGGRTTVTATAADRFERRLHEELAGRGLGLEELKLDALQYGTGAAAGESDVRLLVIGLDGADWQILDKLFEQDRLPHIESLVERGTRARLLSISPLLSPVVWTTVATGVEPTRHGVLDFLVQDSEGNRQPVTSAQRLVPTVWEILSRAGIEVGVTGWWASWPADPVRGYLIADRVAYQLFGYRSDPEATRGKSWPPDLYSEIRPRVVEPSSVDWETVRGYLDDPRESEESYGPEQRERFDELRTAIAGGETYVGIAESLRERFDPRLEVVYLEGTDTVGHLFMPFRPPRLPGISDEDSAAFSGVVDRYYETADQLVGRLLSDREEWTVLLLSDHGFATDATRPRTTDSRIGHGAAADWHRRFGVLILAGPQIRPGHSLAEASVYDIAPTILALFGQSVPRSWPGKVLSQALTDEFLASQPVRYRSDDPVRDPGVDVAADPAAADLIAKLQSLGYVGAGGEGDSRTARNNAGISLLAQGRFEEAEEEFRAGLEVDAPPMPMLLVNYGLTLRLLGRTEEAEQYLTHAVDFVATRRMAANQLALLRHATGDLAGAEAAAMLGLRLEPDAADLRNTLGLILEAGGRVDEASEEYRRSVDLDPDSALARNNLGNLRKRAGDLADAEEWYLRAIEADPYFMGSYNNLALVYQARGDLERAIDLYDRALAKKPGSAVVLNNLGSLYFSSGRHDEARSAWESAAESDPTYTSPWNNLAGLAITLGDLEQAEMHLGRALELDPRYGDARLNLATVRLARNDRAGAREELLRATEDPRSAAKAWRRIGAIEIEQGRPEEAQRAWRRSLELEPRQPQLRAELERLAAAAGR